MKKGKQYNEFSKKTQREMIMNRLTTFGRRVIREKPQVSFSRKGMSLAIETVIVIVLAAAVLSALLYFFMSNWNPANQTIENMRKRTELCNSYLAKDPLCKQENFKDVAVQIPFGTLQDICKKLPYKNYCIAGINLPRGVTNAEWYCAAKCCAEFGCSILGS
jgi:hypothetical protein